MSNNLWYICSTNMYCWQEYPSCPRQESVLNNDAYDSFFLNTTLESRAYLGGCIMVRVLLSVQDNEKMFPREPLRNNISRSTLQFYYLIQLNLPKLWITAGINAYQNILEGNWRDLGLSLNNYIINILKYWIKKSYP